VQPADRTVSAGQTATFSVTATGSGLRYQWRKGGVNISGATAASYTTPATSAADNGALFSVVVSNAGGSVTSRSAKFTVTVAAPVFNPPEHNPTHPATSCTVTLSTTTAGAQMRYTLNNSTPTSTNGTLIAGTSGTVTIQAGTAKTLMAVAFKSGMTTSGVTSGQLAIAAVMQTEEFNSAVRVLGIKQPISVLAVNIVEPTKGLPHLPSSLENVTVDEAFDHLAKTFRVAILYASCPPQSNQPRMITFNSVPLYDSLRPPWFPRP